VGIVLIKIFDRGRDFCLNRDFRLVTKFSGVGMPAEKLCFVMFKIRQAELGNESEKKF